MPYFMVANYGGVTRDAGPLIMEVGATKLYMGAFSFLKGEKNGHRDCCAGCCHVSVQGIHLGQRTMQ